MIHIQCCTVSEKLKPAKLQRPGCVQDLPPLNHQLMQHGNVSRITVSKINRHNAAQILTHNSTMMSVKQCSQVHKSQRKTFHDTLFCLIRGRVTSRKNVAQVSASASSSVLVFNGLYLSKRCLKWQSDMLIRCFVMLH